MSDISKKIAGIALIFILFHGCAGAPQNDASPPLGAIYIGMPRPQAEMSLGYPIRTMDIDSNRYRAVYEYEAERSTFQSVMSVFSNPAQKARGNVTRIAIVYKRDGISQENDHIMAITDDFNNSLMAMNLTDNSYAAVLKADWDEVIHTATMAISIDPRISSAYINRAYAFYRKGLYDMAIIDCNTALKMNIWDDRAYNNRALAYEGKGDIKTAMMDYEYACNLGLNLACGNLNRIKQE